VSDAAPAFRLMLGWQKIGDGWEDRFKGDNSREYIRIEFDDLSFSHPRTAALFPDVEGLSARLVWNRGLPGASGDRP
jgi:uncharacterized protein (DUF736 family)